MAQRRIVFGNLTNVPHRLPVPRSVSPDMFEEENQENEDPANDGWWSMRRRGLMPVLTAEDVDMTLFHHQTTHNVGKVAPFSKPGKDLARFCQGCAGCSSRRSGRIGGRCGQSPRCVGRGGEMIWWPQHATRAHIYNYRMLMPIRRSSTTQALPFFWPHSRSGFQNDYEHERLSQQHPKPYCWPSIMIWQLQQSTNISFTTSFLPTTNLIWST